MTENEFIEHKCSLRINKPVNSIKVYEAIREFYLGDKGATVDYNRKSAKITYHIPLQEISVTVRSKDNKKCDIIIREPKEEYKSLHPALANDRFNIIREKVVEILLEDETLH